MDELPDWPDGTVTILSTGAAGRPHAIPVSTAIRTGPRTIMLALAARRGSLARLRAEPQVALTVLTTDTAFTADATATVVEDELAEAPSVAAVRLDVDDLQDHLQPRFAIEDGVRWRWTDDEAEARDREVRAGLRRLAAERES